MLNVAHSVSLCQGVLFICLHYSIETVFYKDCLKGFRKDFSCKSVVKIINYKKRIHLWILVLAHQLFYFQQFLFL